MSTYTRAIDYLKTTRDSKALFYVLVHNFFAYTTLNVVVVVVITLARAMCTIYKLYFVQ